MLMETSVPTPNFEPKKNIAGVRLEEFLCSLDSILLPVPLSLSLLAGIQTGVKSLVWLQIRRISPKSVDVFVSSSCLPEPAFRRLN